MDSDKKTNPKNVTPQATAIATGTDRLETPKIHSGFKFLLTDIIIQKVCDEVVAHVLATLGKMPSVTGGLAQADQDGRITLRSAMS